MAAVCSLPPAIGFSNVGAPTSGQTNAHSSNHIFGPSPAVASPSFQHVVQPVICAQPPYRGPVLQSILASNKPKSPPDSAGSVATLESPDESEKCSTPYRLPRISPRCSPCTDDSPVPSDSDDKVWGRFGYEDNIRMPELGPNIHKALMNQPPCTGAAAPTAVPQGVGSRSVRAAQRYRQQNAMVVPKFRNAVIKPSVNANVVRDVDDVSVHVYKSFLEKAANREESFHNPAPTPTFSRSVSPAKSTRSIHWTLGSTKQALFDYKGRSRKQGPYSREFTVRCMAPASWMRMKWGRTRNAVH